MHVCTNPKYPFNLKITEVKPYPGQIQSPNLTCLVTPQSQFASSPSQAHGMVSSNLSRLLVELELVLALACLRGRAVSMYTFVGKWYPSRMTFMNDLDMSG